MNPHTDEFIHNNSDSKLIDPNAYKRYKLCAACSGHFGILPNSKRRRCDFCYEAVCQKCSTRKRFSPLLSK